jgi:menaquinone-specific isochorismate synthase
MKGRRILACVTSSGRDARRAANLRVRSVLFDSSDELLRLLPATSALAWVREGEGLVGWGEAARYEVSGYERFSRANRWWSRLCAEATVDDAVLCPGSGPVAFASFGFDQGPGSSVLVVPSVVVGRRDGKTWLTVMTTDPDVALPALAPALVDDVQDPGRITWEGDDSRVARWQDTVAEAIRRINAGELDKVVLARDVAVRAERPLDVRHLLIRLSDEFPECWAFSVDGMVGATPELLVRRNGDQVTSRVLAGTVRTDTDRWEDGRLALELLGSNKDQEEHEYAVRSVAASLSTHCTDLTVPEHPSILRLANVQHLATDVTGLLVDSTNVLALAASLHPTAAVCGTPTERAFALIDRIEGLDRGRYAGPVGWIDSHGDGEFGIALRCGEINSDDPHRIRLFAGCGIVSGSDPAAEVAESEAKLLAMVHALTSD